MEDCVPIPSAGLFESILQLTTLRQLQAAYEHGKPTIGWPFETLTKCNQMAAYTRQLDVRLAFDALNRQIAFSTPLNEMCTYAAKF